MIRPPPRSSQSRSSAASDVYKRQEKPNSTTGNWEKADKQGSDKAYNETDWNSSSGKVKAHRLYICLLYTSDAADDLLCVDLGGRRLIKKKHPINTVIEIATESTIHRETHDDIQ